MYRDGFSRDGGLRRAHDARGRARRGRYGRFLLAGARACVIPGATSGRKPMQHPGEELVHVLSGTLEFTVSGQPYHVIPGSTLHFQGDQSHTWGNPGKIEAHAVWMALLP